MSSMLVWWVAAGLGVALELASGTFYLLMISLGLGTGGLVAYLGGQFSVQVAAAAIVGLGAVAAWHFLRPQTRPITSSQNKNIHLDIGAAVHVSHWRSDGTSRVAYSGSTWDARALGDGVPQPGAYRIHAMEGSVLILVPNQAELRSGEPSAGP